MNRLSHGLAVLALVLSSGHHGASASGAAAGQDPGDSPKKLALLVGINHYRDPNIRVLKGALNDVENMRSVLIGKFDFPEKNIVCLTNEAAKRDAILSALKTHLVGQATKNAIVVFYYSGHGAQVRDQPGGDEGDRLDETLVPSDSTAQGDRDIRDDEIDAILARLAPVTPNVTFIFDSCCSGTATRGVGEVRRVERTFPELVSRSPRGAEVKASGMRDENASHVLISAALSNELAREFRDDGNHPHGALTYFLTAALQRAGSDATYRDVMDVVRNDVKSFCRLQTPQLEGARADGLVFGDGEVLQQKYVLAQPTSAPNEILLESGGVHGATEGSVYAVYPPGTRIFEDAESLGEAEISEVMPDRSRAAWRGVATIPHAARAVEQRHSFGESYLLVRYAGVEHSALLKSISDRLEKLTIVRAASSDDRYHLLLEHVGNAIQIEAADSGAVEEINATAPHVETRVAESVARWAKWYGTLAVRNPSPSPKVRVKFTVEAVGRQGTRSPFSHVGSADAELRPGELIRCVIENRGKYDVFLNILDLSTDGSVTHVHPRSGQELLPRGKTVSIDFETFLPDGADEVTDVLKLLATRTPVRLDFIEQEALTRGESRDLDLDHPVEKLVASAALGTRGPGDPLAADEWVTADRVIRVRK